VLLGVAALLAPAGWAAPPESARVVRCQRSIARVAQQFVVHRRALYSRCIDEALRCGALLDSAPASGDPCLTGVAVRCKRRLGALGRLQSRVDVAALRCTQALPGGAGLAATTVLDPDAVGLDLVSVFCPADTVALGDLGAAAKCQGDALACTADQALLDAVPRAADLLSRLGVPIDSSGACLAATLCGNGRLDDGEECDDGPGNSDDVADACRTDCSRPYCGDGVVDQGEECDDGSDDDGDGCSAACAWEPDACGNTVVDPDEECDDGNHQSGDGCASDCTLEAPAARCGDGVVDDGEDCDDGPANSDVLPDHCRTTCRDPSCGDGAVDLAAGETCEPPGTLLCDGACTLRLGPLGVRREAMSGPIGLADCQAAASRTTRRIFDARHRGVLRCVGGVVACLLGPAADSPGADACLTRATNRCFAVVNKQRAWIARLAPPLAAICGQVPGGLSALLDEQAGLGFSRDASVCPFAGSGQPSVDDLVACVLSRSACAAERAVARAVPRAYELVAETDLDPDADLACLDDPYTVE